MKTFRFLVLLTAGVAATGPALQAQIKPTPHDIEPVSFSFAVKADVNCHFDLSVAGQSAYYSTGLGHTNISTWCKDAPIALNIIVGTVYQIHLSAPQASWDRTDVLISAPPGYKMLINAPTSAAARQMCSYVATPTAGVTDDHYAYFSIVPAAGLKQLAAGETTIPTARGNLNWSVGLGMNRSGVPVGSLELSINSIGSGTFSPSVLGCFAQTEDVYVTTVGGAIRQVFTPEAFVDIHPITQLGALPGFQIDFYGPDDFEGPPDDDGVFEPLDSPWRTLYVQNDHDSGANVDRLKLTRAEGSYSESWRITRTSTSWTVADLDLSRTIAYQSSTLGNGDRQEDVTIGYVSGSTAAKTRRIYHVFDSIVGEELIQEIADPDGAALTTSYDYYYASGDAGTGNWGRLKSISKPDGSWVKYGYYGDGSSGEYGRFGQLKAVYSSWRDSSTTASTANSSNCNYTLYDYVAERSIFQESLDTTETHILGTTTGRTSNSPAFGSTANSQPLRVETVHTYTGTSAYLTTSRKIYHDTASVDYAGKLCSQTNPDGSKISAYYIFADTTSTIVCVSGWSTAVTGSSSVTSVEGHAVDQIYLVPNRSTRRVEQLILGGITYDVVTTQLYTGSDTWVTIAEQSTRYDGSYQIYAADTLRDTYDHVREWGAGGVPTLDTLNDGGHIGYSADARGRIAYQRKYNVAAYGNYPAQDWIYTHFQYDAADHVIWQRVNTGSDPTASGLTTTTTYDLAGRISSTTDPSGLTTTYAYSNGGRTTTVTVPGGGTKITDHYLDGTLKSVTGTAAANSYQATVVNSDGTLTTTTYALRSSDLSSPTSAPRWANVTADWAGRKVSEQKPAPGSTTFTRGYYYDATSGNLIKTTEPGLADTLTDYNEFGEAYRSGLDIDASGTLTTNSTDRLTETDVTFVNASSAWWKVTTTLGYNLASSGTSYTSGVAKERLTGFSGTLRDETYLTDLFGNVIHHTIDIDRSHQLVTDTTDVPDSTANQVKFTYNGLAVAEQSTQNLTSYFHYDSVGRPTGHVNPRTGTTTTAYYTSGTGAIGQISSVTDAAGNTTGYDYDSSTGRLVATTNALGKTSRQSYNTRGQITRAWGEATYPVEYGFNDYGEQTTMSTFRGGTGWDGSTWPSSPGTADTTTWAYDAATGTLTSKTDAQSHAVTYTYNTRAQLSTRTWARGVTTSYAYDTATAEQRDIVYDDSTPALHYYYNRLGQVSQVDDLTGTRLLEHCICGKLVGETLDSTFFEGRKIVHQTDSTTTGALGRTTGFTLSGPSNSGTEYAVTYGYESTYARLNGVALSSGPSFSYTFTSNSGLIAGISESGSTWTQTRTWVSNRDLLASVDTSFASASKGTFAYAYDALGRRSSTVETGELFARYERSALSILHGYNDRSELTSSATYYGNAPSDTSYPVVARTFAYAYDNIGNRSSSTTDGVGPSYTPNSLNQYASRTIPDAFTITGLAPTASTVTVDGNGTTRQGQYYSRAASLANGSAPAWASFTIAGSLGGSISRGQFLPQTPENYTYDADGNLTLDGRWHYWWDGENRLIAMETIGHQSGDSTAVWNSGVPRQRLEFLYDYLGRRVAKKTYAWSGSAFALSSETRFIYEDWNLVADYAVSGGTFTTAHRYVWGLDLTGTLHDGGGVGGLLAVISAAGTTHLPIFDGNGNVMGFVDRSTGALTAQYEYSPFGEPLLQTGAYAASIPFRFSTKYADDETRLLWYGYRFYDPELGRFVGRDPLEEKGGLHLYAFTKNNPVNAWDEFGEYEPVEMKPFTTSPGECNDEASYESTDANGCTTYHAYNECSNSPGGWIEKTNCPDYSNGPPSPQNPVATTTDSGHSDDPVAGSGPEQKSSEQLAAIEQFKLVPDNLKKDLCDEFLDPKNSQATYGVQKTVDGNDFYREISLKGGLYSDGTSSKIVSRVEGPLMAINSNGVFGLDSEGNVFSYQSNTIGVGWRVENPWVPFQNNQNYPAPPNILTTIYSFHSHPFPALGGLSNPDVLGLRNYRYPRAAPGAPENGYTVFGGAFDGGRQLFFGTGKDDIKYQLSFSDVKAALGCK
ncbi:MAG TPA: RHS repeat-associated core domain-containing protein [Opitutaceae bacterium]|nr:RHS repeat-associated core domain-containing protein [Opitutaceae bacterium]